MAYVKPGVEIQQVIKTQTPVLDAPELVTCIVGHGYHWQDVTKEESLAAPITDGVKSTTLTRYVGNTLSTITLSGYINSENYTINTTDDDLVIVDLVGVSGYHLGEIIHLNHFSDNITYSNGAITIPEHIGQNDSDLYSTTPTTSGATEYIVRVGYRAAKAKSEGFKTISSFSDLSEFLGEPVSWNPLGYGTYIAMANAGTAISTLGLVVSGTTIADLEHMITTSSDTLESKEVYAMAFLSQDGADAGVGQTLKTICDTASLPINKHERIGFITLEQDYSFADSTAKNTFASAIKDMNANIQSKRIISIYPQLYYITETRPIATVHPEWIQTSFSDFISKNTGNEIYTAKLTTKLKIGKDTYFAGTPITSDLWSTLRAAGWGGESGLVTVEVPVPGFYATAIAAGQVAGLPISQSHTNLATTGLDKTYASTDLLSEAQLNTIASAGVYIMCQDSPAGAIYCRHQQTTDFKSVITRELSITKAVDYTAKYVRNNLKPYIGKYNINPSTLELFNAILTGIGKDLVAKGILAEFKIGSVTQDTLNPDTLYIDISIKPFYPVNYIKISLII